MIARTVHPAVADAGRPPLYVRLAHALTACLRGANAVADDLGWSAWRWYEVHRSVQALSHLDDHMLNDIGVPRSTIVSAAVGRVAEEEEIRRRVPW